MFNIFTYIDLYGGINMDDKPEKWPANAIECQLDNLYTQIKKFKEYPSYKNKEVLISLVSDYNLTF